MAEEKKVDPIGGQAVIEGVMMRGKKRIAVAMRTPKKSIIVESYPFIPWTKRFPVLGLAIIRGFITMVEMMVVGSKILMRSADVSLPEAEKKQMQGWEMPFSYVLGFGLSVVLFIIIPAYVFTILRSSVQDVVLLNICEGFVRLSIFLMFLAVISLMSDMRRVFEYHGAEHMVVNMYEHKVPLTVTNAKKFSVRHPRCGTSFLLVVMVVSIVVFTFLGRPDMWHRVLYKLALLPLISGLSYEVIRLTDRWKGGFLKVLTWPGMMVQFFTTRQPSKDQIEVAIRALKAAVKA